MSLPTVLSLIALLVAIFAVLAVFAVYNRLRLVERMVLNPRAAMLADEERAAPAVVRPHDGERAALVLLVDPGCVTCDSVMSEIVGHAPADVRLVAVFPTAGPAPSSVDQVVDPDAWSALYEGYAPCLYVVEPDGRVAQRRFVYADTDLGALIGAILPASAPSGSINAA
jgi:hypothetical protein